MSLSNLIWWPWFGIGGDAPPTPDEPPWFRGGDRRLHNEVIRTNAPHEDGTMEEILAAIINEV